MGEAPRFEQLDGAAILDEGLLVGRVTQLAGREQVPFLAGASANLLHYLLPHGGEYVPAFVSLDPAHQADEAASQVGKVCEPELVLE